MDFALSIEIQCSLTADQLRILLMEEHLNHSKVYKDTLKLVIEPVTSKHVVVEHPIDKGGLVLVPVGPNVGVSVKPPANTVDLGLMQRGIDGKLYYGYASQCHRKREEDEHTGSFEKKSVSEFYAPFWLVVATQNSKEVNCEYFTIKRRVPGKGPSAGDYYLTVLVNSKPLVKGDILMAQQSSSRNKYPDHSRLKVAKLA